jgi:hypothetical protein
MATAGVAHQLIETIPSPTGSDEVLVEGAGICDGPLGRSSTIAALTAWGVISLYTTR